MKTRFVNRVIAVIAVITLVLGLTPGSDLQAKPKPKPAKKPAVKAVKPAPKIVKIGFIAPLTGDVATFGETTRNGFNLALDQVNRKAGAFTLQAVIADDQNDASIAAVETKELIERDKVQLVVGSVTSVCSIEISEVANAYKIPQIACTATNPKVTVDAGKRKPYAFRTCFIDPYQGNLAAHFALNQLKAKKAAVLYDSGNDYTCGLADVFKRSFEKGGGTVEVYEEYSQTDTDFAKPLQMIARQNVDVLFLPDYYEKVSEIGVEARKQDLKCTFLGGDGWDSVDLDFEAMDQGYFINHYSCDNPRAETQRFVKQYQDRYGCMPDALAALAYDSANLAIQAIKIANSNDPVKIKNALQGLKNVPTTCGPITSFDSDGNPQKPGVVIQIKDGRQVFVTEINSSAGTGSPAAPAKPAEKPAVKPENKPASKGEAVVGGMTLVPYTSDDFGITMLAPKGWIAFPSEVDGEGTLLFVSNNDDTVFLTLMVDSSVCDIFNKAGNLESGFKVLSKLAATTFENLKTIETRTVQISGSNALEATETFVQSGKSYKVTEVYVLQNGLCYNAIYKTDPALFDKYKEPLVRCIESLQITPRSQSDATRI